MKAYEYGYHYGGNGQAGRCLVNSRPGGVHLVRPAGDTDKSRRARP